MTWGCDLSRVTEDKRLKQHKNPGLPVPAPNVVFYLTAAIWVTFFICFFGNLILIFHPLQPKNMNPSSVLEGFIVKHALEPA